MTSPLRSLYHFLGGVLFAILLIAATALFVIAGTLIESASQSHRYASLFTYDNLFFSALLWGFFINILFAATRRWPFRLKHIPFLITHLGLLMILAGVIAKRHYGLQGTMSLIEGSGSDRVALPDTYAIALESKAERIRHLYPLRHTWKGDRVSYIGKGPGGVTLRLADFTPHANSHLATWVKGQAAYIAGLSPLPLEEHQKGNEVKPGGKVRFHQGDAPVWDLYALNTDSVNEVVEELSANPKKWPLIAILEDREGDVTLAAIDPHGTPWTSFYKKEGLDQLIAYDEGFGGYSVRAELPFITRTVTPEEQRHAAAVLIEQQLREADIGGVPLSPPLQLLKEGCRAAGTDFPSTAVAFLVEWDRSGRWLISSRDPLPEPLQKSLAALPWESISPQEHKGCHLALLLEEHIGDELASGDDPLDVLKRHQWPLAAPLEQQMSEPESPPALILLTRQIFMAAQVALLGQSCEDDPALNATLFSAYLSAYGITLKAIAPDAKSPEITALVHEKRKMNSADRGPEETIALETSITQVFTPLPPGKKLEDNVPMATVHVLKGKRAQMIRLGFDRTGSGLKWPVLDGDYLLRFQSDYKEIPYRVRLRQARQINYANSSQPYSYESDLIITDKRNEKEIEQTISMNRVHESPDGYRFYLSTISVPQEDNVKRVTIVVNYDPAKYWLTYPGAVILTCGIIMLFLMRPYRRRD